MSETQDLQFFISAKGPFVVVSFIGKMTKATTGVLESCQTELEKQQAQFYVLTFHDVSQVEKPAIAALVRLQKAIRDKAEDVQLRVCQFRPDVKDMLLTAAAIRQEETKNNLQEALTSFRR